MGTISRVRDARGVSVNRIIGSPDQPALDYPAQCGRCGQVSTAEEPDCRCAYAASSQGRTIAELREQLEQAQNGENT